MRALLDRVARHGEVEKVFAALELEALLVGQVQEADEVERHGYARLLLLIFRSRNIWRPGQSRDNGERNNDNQSTLSGIVLWQNHRRNPFETGAGGKRKYIERHAQLLLIVVGED